MGESSDRPTWSKRLKPGALDRWHNSIKSAYGIVVVAVAVFTAALAFMRSFATDEELQQHDMLIFAHPPVRLRVERLEEELAQCNRSAAATRADVVDLGARLVRLIAADAETRRELRADAATFYEREYVRLVRRGLSVEDAITDALKATYRRFEP